MKGANNYSLDEIQVALANSPDGDPLTWLNENWMKLIETVQTLATKYGQEHKENIVGTISATEAREMLIKNKGSVWHAVTQCIEQRQQAYNTIKAQGNYSREDIVTSLTAHNGNAEMAMAELNRLQMKPFLLKIQSSPAGASSDAAIEQLQPSTSSQPTPEQINSVGTDEAATQEMEKPNDEKNDILKDIEAIIGSMEEKQSKQTETLLSTIENLVGNMILTHSSRTMSSASSFSGLDRIDAKSPILIPSKVSNSFDDNADVQTEVKNFVSRHIQDVVPDVAALINKELTETHAQNIETEQSASENQPESETLKVENEQAASLSTTDQPEVVESPVQPIQTEQSVEFNEPVVEANIQIAVNEPQTPHEDVNPTTEETQNDTPQTLSLAEEEPIRNDLSRNEIPNTVEPPKVDTVIQQSTRVNMPRYVVTKSSGRFTQKQVDKRRIRELEKQLKKRQKSQRRASMNTDRSDSQNTGYLSDSTVIADDLQSTEHPTVSNEKTFSLSIVEQAALVDDNKEHNQSMTRQSPHNLIEVNPGTSAMQQSEEPLPNGESNEDSSEVMPQNEAMKDMKNRNLSELVEDTKSLIQQMKNEIDEDIAMSASEFGDGDNDGYLSDEILYSDEEMGEFSDSWEDMSEEGSVISEGDEFSEHSDYDQHENDFEFQRSSQSVESEFYVEARESLTSENEQIDDENEENLSLENIGVIEEQHEESNAINDATQFGNQSSTLPTIGALNNDHIEMNNTESRSVDENHDINILSESNPVLIKNQQNVTLDDPMDESQTEVNTVDDAIMEQSPHENSVNENEIQTASVSQAIDESFQSTDTSDSVNTPVPPTDDNLIEHMLEIQQSLGTSSIISVNFRETQLRENSQSVEPSAETPISSNPQSPDPPHSEIDEANSVDQQDSISEPSNEEASINISENVENLVNEARTLEQIEAVQSPTVSDIQEHDHDISDQENPKEDEDNSVSVSDNQPSLSSEKVSNANDTESEMEELADVSVSTSTSESSSGKDISIQSTLSTISTAASETLVESYKYQKITLPVVTQCSSSSINLMQLKKTTPTDKLTVKNKIPVRRPSFTEPSASIRNIQNELFNKQLRQPPKIVSKKPSKIVPPKLFFKSTASESNLSVPGPSKQSKEDHNKPSTSSGMQTIPKKKYYETCFSDDNYQTSDDETPMTNMKAIPNLVKIVETNTEENFDIDVSDKHSDDSKMFV